MARSINTYADGSGGWYVLRLCGRYLTGFTLWGRPKWGHGINAVTFKQNPADWVDYPTLSANVAATRLCKLNPCVESVPVRLQEGAAVQ